MMTFGANRCLTIKTKKEMKKNLFMVAAVALMALVSCNKEEINNSVVEQPQEEPTVIVEFEAGFDVETKTALDAEGKKTVWKSDDRISINGQEFKVSEIKEDGKAIFVNVNNLPSDFAAPFTAIYPYGSDGSVPAEQDAVAGNFDPKAVIEKATSDNYSLSFKNETSLLKFQVPASAEFSEKISSVSITSTDVLAGSDAKTVTINCADGFDSDKTYYVAVLPGEKKNFVVRVNGYLSRRADKVNVTRSPIINMKTLPAPVASGWTIVGAHNSWDTKTGIKLYNDITGSVAKNVSGGSEFKLVRDGKDWFSTMVPAGKKGSWCKLHQNRVNMKPAAGTVDVWVNADGTACGIVDKNASMPSTYQYYVVLQHNWDWKNRKLHSWIVNPESNLMGNWPGSSPTGTFNYDNNGYSFWEIPIKANGVKIGVIFSNNGADQTQNNYIDPLNTDKCYWLEYRSGKGNFPVEM